jgi:hypothetical protein
MWAEQHAFSRYGLTYVVEEYLTVKLKEIDQMREKGIIYAFLLLFNFFRPFYCFFLTF